MPRPQQPEAARSARTPIDPASAKSNPAPPGAPEAAQPAPGPVPEENRPGHHPPVEQDKPTGPPPSPGRDGDGAGQQRFPFTFDWRTPLTAAAGATPWTAEVTIDDERLRIRYGPWLLSTPRDNVAGTSLTGPCPWWRAGGPPRVGRDREVTFATAPRPGVRIEFVEPVPGALPFTFVRHPAATVTVRDPEALAGALGSG